MNENILIEDRLHSANYQTERRGGIVLVHDPVHTLIGREAVIKEWRLVEIRTILEAWAFIEARS
ncbi:MAG: hypothetical protein PHX24_03560 [Acidithiobacillus sp.]|nr:hypothetical protein [Acidithiobacillus sp.]